MSYVLVIVVVFSSAAGVATDTRTVEFDNEAACQRAQTGVEQGVLNIKGTLGRQLFVDCYPKK